MKNLERKKKEQTKGRTNRRMPICNSTIQLVVVELYTKYEDSILNDCGDIFDEKVLRNYGRTDGRTDGTTDRCKPVYPPLFQSGGIKILLLFPYIKKLHYSHLKHPPIPPLFSARTILRARSTLMQWFMKTKTFFFRILKLIIR